MLCVCKCMLLLTPLLVIFFILLLPLYCIFPIVTSMSYMRNFYLQTYIRTYIHTTRKYFNAFNMFLSTKTFYCSNRDFSAFPHKVSTLSVIHSRICSDFNPKRIFLLTLLCQDFKKRLMEVMGAGKRKRGLYVIKLYMRQCVFVLGLTQK